MFEKLIDKLKEIPPKILAWWNKFTKNQKMIIISVALGVAIAFGILIFVVTRTQYVTLVTCDSTAQTGQVKDLLDSNGIAYKISDDGLVVQVDKTKLSDANIILGSNNILTDDYDLDSVLGGSLSTTEADKQKKYTAYREKKLKDDLENMSFIESASVTMFVPENDGTLIRNNKESHVEITLKLNGECTSENAAAIARMAKTVVGNETTDNIVILDTDGNLLFSGGEDSSISGLASSTLSVKQEAERVLKNNVQNIILGTKQFDYVVVSPNLELDLSSKEVSKTTYTPAEDQTQGLLSHETHYNAESEGGSGLVPGTDSNVEQNGTTYVYENGGGSSSTVEQYEKDYLPNSETTISQIPAGGIVYKDSSIAVTAIRLKVIKEEDAKAQGLLDEMSWDEYKLANANRTKLELDEEYYSLISDTSGIDKENISMVAYEEPFFVDKMNANFNWTDIIQIGLIVVILLLLGMVVLRTLKTEKSKEEEPEEISVENLLQTMPQDQLEDIDLEAKSENRRMIEKFVDENPEAVANLLRNWLTEDWG